MTKEREEKVAAIKKTLDKAFEGYVGEGPATKEVTIGVMDGGPEGFKNLAERLEAASRDTAKRLLVTEELWNKAKAQSDPVCCFCHRGKIDSHALIQGYAPDKRPIFICSDCIMLSLNLLQKRGVKVGPTF